MKLCLTQLGIMTIIVGILMPIPVFSHSLKGAISDRDRVIKINPNDALAVLGRGLAKLALGDNNGAIADFDRVLITNPNDDLAVLCRGLAKSALGDNNGAIADFDRAIKINQNLAEAYMG